jgi:hypothetical protein
MRIKSRRLGEVRWGACMQWGKAFQLWMCKVTPVWWCGVQVGTPVKCWLSLIVEACCTSNDANQWPGGTGKMGTETGFCFQGKNGGNRILFPQCSVTWKLENAYEYAQYKHALTRAYEYACIQVHNAHLTSLCAYEYVPYKWQATS